MPTFVGTTAGVFHGSMVRPVGISRKPADYFQLPSVQHYLILFSDRVRAIHHRRDGDRIETRVLADGDVMLNPPGITVALARLYPVGESQE